MFTQPNNFYSKNALAIDLCTFTGASAFFTATSGLLSPSALGVFSLAAVNASVIHFASGACEKKNIPPFWKVSSIVAGIAFSIFTMPALITVLGAHTYVFLNLKAALTMSIVHLIVKVSLYALFKFSLYLRDSFFFALPSSAVALTKMEKNRLEEVKNHLINFPRPIPLLFQITLNDQLRKSGFLPLPMKTFSEVEHEWTKEQLDSLAKEDISAFPLEKKTAVNELFFYHNYPPQKRDYQPEEMPEIDYGSLEKNLTFEQLQWIHLIARVKPNSPLYASIAKKLYENHFSPPREKINIDLPLPASEEEVRNSKDWKISWWENDFKTHPEKWDRLFLPIQKALNARFQGPRMLTGKIVQQISPIQTWKKRLEQLPWKEISLVAAAIGLVYLSYTPNTISPEQAPSLTDVILEKITPPSTALVPTTTPANFDKIDLPLYLPYVQEILPETRSYAKQIFLAGSGLAAAAIATIWKRKLSSPMEEIEDTDLDTLLNGPPGENLISSNPDPQVFIFSPEENFVLDPQEKSKKKPDWEKFEDLVLEHCPNVNCETAKYYAKLGVNLINDLHAGNKIEPKDLEKKFIAVCWGLWFQSIENGQAFKEGTIVLDGTEIFDFFLPFMYGRSSSHFPKQAIPIEEGPWKGYSHFGFDPKLPLPAGKGTILMGKIQFDPKGPQKTYLKMETHGTRFSLNPTVLWGTLMHGYEFARNQVARKFFDIDSGELKRKEHLLEDDRKVIQNICSKAQKHISFVMPDLKNYGFLHAIPLLENLSESEKVPCELKEDIAAYLQDLVKRFGTIKGRKGNEVIVNEMNDFYVSKVNDADEIITTFTILGKDAEDESKKSCEKFLGKTYLSQNDFIELAGLIQNPDSLFLSKFLFPRENTIEEFNAIIARKCQEYERTYIPLILNNRGYFYSTEKTVLLIHEKGKWTYFDPAGGRFETESGIVSGFDCPIQKLFNKDIETKLSRNPGVNDRWQICHYMMEQQNWIEEKNLALSFKNLKQELLNALRIRYAPYNEATDQNFVYEKLKHESERTKKQKLNAILGQNIQDYTYGEEIDRQALFKQIDKDLTRGCTYTINECSLSDYGIYSAQDLYHYFKSTLNKNKEEILRLMSLLQQGAFGSLIIKLRQEMKIGGFDSPFDIRGQGKTSEKQGLQRKVDLDIQSDGSIRIACTTPIEFISTDPERINLWRDQPYALLEGKVEIDTSTESAFESWKVLKIIR